MKWCFIGGPPERWFIGLGLGHGFTGGGVGGGRGDGEDGYKGGGGSMHMGNRWSPHYANTDCEYFVAVEEDS